MNWSPEISMSMSIPIELWITEIHSLLSLLSKQQVTLGTTRRTSTALIVSWTEEAPLPPRKIINSYNLGRLHKKDSRLPLLQRAHITKLPWTATPNLCRLWVSKEHSLLHHTLPIHRVWDPSQLTRRLPRRLLHSRLLWSSHSLRSMSLKTIMAHRAGKDSRNRMSLTRWLLSRLLR